MALAESDDRLPGLPEQTSEFTREMLKRSYEHLAISEALLRVPLPKV